jgi:hypothetical protein
MTQVLIAQAVLFGIISAVVANQKNRGPVQWFFLGLAFGVFGFIGSLIVSDVRADSGSESTSFDPERQTKKCPDCAERIKLEARVCRYCNNEFLEAQVEKEINNARQRFERRTNNDEAEEEDKPSVKEDMAVLAIIALLIGGMLLMALLAGGSA